MTLPKPLPLDLLGAIQRHAQAGRVALIVPAEEKQPERYVSYAELAEKIAAYALGCSVRLRSNDAPADVRPMITRDVPDSGRYVGIVAERGAEAIAVFLGLIEAGFVPVFMESRISPAVFAERMDAVGMQILVTDTPAGKVFPRNAHVHLFSELNNEATTAWKAPTKRPDEPAFLLFTSGSTGASKGVLLSHSNLASNATGITAMTGLTNEDRLLHIMPLYHTNGVNNQIIAPFLAGATVVLASHFDAAQALSLMERYAITYMTGVPTHYSRMLSLPSLPKLPALRFLRCGSAPITRELHRAIEKAFGIELLVSYGLSEACCTTTMNPPGNRRIGSIGKVLEGQRVVICKPGSQESVGTGEEGEICIEGPSLMLGYVGKAALEPVQDGRLRTGDVGYLDEDGFLYITGRIKDIIVRGGENLSPGLIENTIRTHAGVLDCCVVGVPSSDLGEVPAAFVVGRVSGAVTEKELQRVVADALKPNYVPVFWHFVDGLPNNAVGKIDRKALKILAAEVGFQR